MERVRQVDAAQHLIKNAAAYTDASTNQLLAGQGP